MKKNLLAIGMLASAVGFNAQVLTHVDNTAVLYVGDGALMYNGGGLQTKGSGILDVHGNVMVEGAGSDVVRTLDASGNALTSAAGNIVLRLNNPAAPTTSTYGQLYIQGIPQTNLTGFVSKEFRTPAHGSGNYFQQIALPFNGKALSTLSTEFAKTFGTTRWTQNEILKFNNTTVVSEHFTNLGTATADPTGYYMLGSSNNNLNTATPPTTLPTVAPTAPGSVYTVHGRPYANGISRTLSGAGAGINFGWNGNGTNQYNELYNSYLQDAFSVTTGAWTGDFARNIYQFGNPYLTNLDLGYIGFNETNGDGNYLEKIWGVQYDPGVVKTLPNGTTYFTNAKHVTFTSSVPVGDVGMIIKPMQPFIIKMRDNTTSPQLNFDNLRRFGYGVRNASNPYSVTSQRNFNVPKKKSVKQLGFIAYDANDNELGRGYYVVSPTMITGHQNDGSKSVQVANSAGSAIGTFEEHPVNGMFDSNYSSKYWLYINEANENDFRGKPAPMVVYNTAVKKIEFEIRENAELIPQGQHQLSSTIGFFYKLGNGPLTPIKQGDKIPVNISSNTTYRLYYGGPVQSDFDIFAKNAKDVEAPSRTMVVYNPAIDHYVVRFDPAWKSAQVQVFDMSGKLVLRAENVDAKTDFEIKLDKNIKTTYLVKVISDQGVEANAKIIR